MGGAGFAMVGTTPVFVTGAIPGQKVAIVITKHKENYAEAKVQKVLLKSKDESMAKCVHFWQRVRRLCLAERAV